MDAIRGPNGTDYSIYVEALYEDEVVYHKKSKLYKAPYTITDGKAVLGEAIEVVEETRYKPVFTEALLFEAFKQARADGMIVRVGKIFEAGEYPDKGVTYTEDALDEAIEGFTPVDNDLEHRSTILDGKLGQLEKVWRKGKELFGQVAIPAWLDDLVGTKPIKVSLAWSRATKRIVGNALVLNPRIADATIFAAYPSSRDEGRSEGSTPPMKKIKIVDYIKAKFGLDSVEDLDMEVPVPEEAAAAPQPAPQAEVPTPAPTFTATEEDKATAARLAALEAQLVRERSIAFANDVVGQRKALPAQRDAIAGLYVQVVTADAAGKSLFSATGEITEGEAVAKLKAFFAAAPEHKLVGESLKGGDAGLIVMGKPEKSDDDDAKHLLGLTQLGRAGAAAKN